ncbi:MAG TPA: hypothetical protein VGC56_08025 [Allosphingosinicella sp.]
MAMTTRLAPALLLLIAGAPAAAMQSGKGLAPPVVRNAPASKEASPEPVAKSPDAVPAAAKPLACGAAAAQPCGEAASPRGTPQDYAAALTAAGATTGGDPVLDKGLIATMSRLLAAGRCADAAALATRSGRPRLASRAQQVCSGR